jgi:hypothetical protein
MRALIIWVGMCADADTKKEQATQPSAGLLAVFTRMDAQGMVVMLKGLTLAAVGIYLGKNAHMRFHIYIIVNIYQLTCTCACLPISGVDAILGNEELMAAAGG